MAGFSGRGHRCTARHGCVPDGGSQYSGAGSPCNATVFMARCYAESVFCEDSEFPENVSGGRVSSCVPVVYLAADIHPDNGSGSADTTRSIAVYTHMGLGTMVSKGLNSSSPPNGPPAPARLPSRKCYPNPVRFEPSLIFTSFCLAVGEVELSFYWVQLGTPARNWRRPQLSGRADEAK